jgi:nicotinate dehydrogenase FAD-subunit
MLNIQYCRPKTLSDALKLLREAEFNNKVLAGGTDLLVKLRESSSERCRLVDVSRLSELKKIEVNANQITIGAGVTFSEIIGSELLKKNVPLLVQACSQIGGPQVRNKGTIGGNVVNAAVCADTLPVLVCLDAEANLMDGRSQRNIRVAEFVASKNKTDIKSGEVLTHFTFNLLPESCRTAHIKLGRRNAMAISRISLALLGWLDDKNHIETCRIVFGAVSESVNRFDQVEKALLGKTPSKDLFDQCGRIAAEQLIHLQGRRWSTEYKEKVVANLIVRALEQAFLPELKDGN